jgi:hypothetical protein
MFAIGDTQKTFKLIFLLAESEGAKKNWSKVQKQFMSRFDFWKLEIKTLMLAN